LEVLSRALETSSVCSGKRARSSRLARFLLDFNGLQGGKKAAPDAGAGSGARTPAAQARPARPVLARPPRATTAIRARVDRCDATASGGCAHAYTEGLGLEKDFAPLLADTQYRVTMTAGSDAFYFSTFSVTGNKPESRYFGSVRTTTTTRR